MKLQPAHEMLRNALRMNKKLHQPPFHRTAWRLVLQIKSIGNDFGITTRCAKQHNTNEDEIFRRIRFRLNRIIRWELTFTADLSYILLHKNHFYNAGLFVMPNATRTKTVAFLILYCDITTVVT